MAPITLQGPLSEVSRDARAYPVHLLREGDTGLCLFAAAFLGRNDVIHMTRNNMSVTCVDKDGDRLTEMADLYYGAGHPFAGIIGDAWSYAEQWRRGGAQWDVVSVDTYTGDATDRSLESLDLWCSLARRVVTATCPAALTPNRAAFMVPKGWMITTEERSNLASWLVLTRA